MKTLIVYCSKYKYHTEKIAHLFARHLKGDMVNIKDVDAVSVENYDLIGFGSGVYKERLSPKLYQVTKQWDLENKKVFVFSTSGIGMKFYNKPLIRHLISKGAIHEGSFACKGSFNAKDFTRVRIFRLFEEQAKGHPNKQDYEKAQKFVFNLKSRLE
ncbi:MAG TPA: flavodoxin [Eubacteriaceae bacterium]|nr:flavodoxin [Eubacteriaceae bacterium]